MAGDWIKMRTALWDHPKVVKIASAICPQSVRDLSARCRIVGALFRTWSLADAHTDDGILDGYDADALDAAVGIDGWSLNLEHVGWLVVEPQRLIVPRFTDHNGESAKRRADDAARKRRVRKMSANRRTNVRKMSAKCPPREEKRREELIKGVNPLNNPPANFVKPTIDEVRAYCAERKNGVDPQAFVDFYESKGWMIGKNRMKDWQAAVRTWEKSSNGTGYGKQNRPRVGPGQQYDPNDASERSL